MKPNGDKTGPLQAAFLQERPPIPLRLKAALKAVEVWLATCRPVIVRSRCASSLFREEYPLKPVVALWHSALVYTLYHFRVYRGTIMTSPSRDGEWIANTIVQWGQFPVRGSRHKGGLKAIRQMAEIMKHYHVPSGIVADGSKGPAGIAQLGAVILARDTGSPIIPTGFAADRAIYFNSWDRMVLPLPFSRVCIVYGEAITVPSGARGLAVERCRKRLETSLHQATRQARERIGI